MVFDWMLKWPKPGSPSRFGRKPVDSLVFIFRPGVKNRGRKIRLIRGVRKVLGFQAEAAAVLIDLTVFAGDPVI